MSWKLAIGLALLVALAFPPFGLWPLSFVAFVFFARAMLQDWNATKKRSALFIGTYSFAVNVFGFYWITYTLHEFGDLPWIVAGIVAMAMFALLSVLSLFMGWLWPPLATRAKPALRAPLLFVWFLLWDSIDLRFFPWSPVMAVGSDRHLMAAVGLWGTWGWRILFFAGVTSIAHWSLRLPRRRFAAYATAVVGTLLLITYGAGFYNLHRLQKLFPDRQPVALLQGNVGNFEKRLSKLQIMPTVNNVLRLHQKLIEKAALHFAELGTDPRGSEPWIIWPETSFPGYPLTNSRMNDGLMDWVRLTHGLHIVGAYESALVPFGGEMQKLDFNIVALYHEGPGYVAHYRKRILIPFGEYIPGDEFFPNAYKFLPAVNHFGKGEGFTPLPHPDPNGPVFIPVVCYEILFHSFVRDFVSEARRKYPGRPLVIVNPTNDSWYGPTSEPFQHSLLARWQAASLELPLLRATNTGLSQVVAPWGEVMATAARDETLVVLGELPVQKLQKRIQP